MDLDEINGPHSIPGSGQPHVFLPLALDKPISTSWTRTDDRVTIFFRDGIEPGQTVEMKASEVFPANAPGLKPSLGPVYLIGKNREMIADGRMTGGELAELEALRKKAGS